MTATTTDKVLRTALERATPLLDRFGVLATPLRDVFEARRSITIERPMDEVAGRLRDGRAARTVFASEVSAESGAASSSGVSWRLDGRGSAEVQLRAGPKGSTVVALVIRLERVMGESPRRPRYADNAGVVAARALHRLKSLVETGEVASLARNPAARPEPDPYGD